MTETASAKPDLRRADLAQGIEIPAETLREMLGQVLFAASVDEARPILTGVKVEIKGDVVVMVASDGFRLALRAARLSRAVAEPLSLVIPARSLSELRRLAITDEPVVLCVPPGRGQAIFHHGPTEVAMQLIEGAFPEYSAIELAPHDANYYVHRGVTYNRTGDNNKAIADFNRAIELDPRDAECFFRRGVSYKAEGIFDWAVRDFSHAIELDPKKGKFYYWRGDTYWALNELDRGDRDFAKARVLGYQPPENG